MWQSARVFEQAIDVGVFLPPPSAIVDEDAGDGTDGGESKRDHLEYDKSLGIDIIPGAPVRPALARLRPDCVAAAKVDVMADLLQFRVLERVAEL